MIVIGEPLMRDLLSWSAVEKWNEITSYGVISKSNLILFFELYLAPLGFLADYYFKEGSDLGTIYAKMENDVENTLYESLIYI